MNLAAISRVVLALFMALVFAGPTTLAADDKKADDKKADDENIKLPSKFKWEFTELKKTFTVVKATYDEEERKTTLVIEAKNDKAVLPLLFWKFFDADDIKLVSFTLEYFPHQPMKKGDKTRIVMKLPAESILKETKKIVIDTTR